jgi:hypothetical protein
MSSLFALLVHKETSSDDVSAGCGRARSRNTPSTMWNRCVVQWLDELRYAPEYYDEVASAMTSRWLRINYGQVCRVSVNFGDSVERLRREPVVYETLDDDAAEDVVMWKRQLRHSYCGEEEHFLENEVEAKTTTQTRLVDSADKRYRGPNGRRCVDVVHVYGQENTMHRR